MVSTRIRRSVVGLGVQPGRCTEHDDEAGVCAPASCKLVLPPLPSCLPCPALPCFLPPRPLARRWVAAGQPAEEAPQSATPASRLFLRCPALPAAQPPTAATQPQVRLTKLGQTYHALPCSRQLPHPCPGCCPDCSLSCRSPFLLLCFVVQAPSPAQSAGLHPPRPSQAATPPQQGAGRCEQPHAAAAAGAAAAAAPEDRLTDNRCGCARGAADCGGPPRCGQLSRWVPVHSPPVGCTCSTLLGKHSERSAHTAAAAIQQSLPRAALKCFVASASLQVRCEFHRFCPLTTLPGPHPIRSLPPLQPCSAAAAAWATACARTAGPAARAGATAAGATTTAGVLRSGCGVRPAKRRVMQVP